MNDQYDYHDEQRVRDMFEDLHARTPSSEREEKHQRQMDGNNQELATKAWYAVSLVLRATGEDFDWCTELRLWPEKARRLWHRSHLIGRLEDEEDAYYDDGGRLVLSGLTALHLATALAAADPAGVAAFVAEQRRLGPKVLPGGVDEDDAGQAYAAVNRWTKQTGRLDTIALSLWTAASPVGQ